MGGQCRNNASDINKQDKPEVSSIDGAYICIFFDGTGNNMYEQLNKGELLRDRLTKASKEHPTTSKFSMTPTLFSPLNPVDDMLIRESAKKWESVKYDISNYGMTHYFEQKEQAEQDYEIADKRGDKNSNKIEDNGGLKYSNVAILRSLTKKKPEQPTDGGDGKVCINYSLYIEGSGQKWDTGFSPVGLGMGTGRTGVVGLVSKAMVFVQEFLDSQIIDPNNRESVELHFAFFGFSRGSTCARVFTYLVTQDPATLPKIGEFKQYLPERYYKGEKCCFLDEYKKKTVDFLGIYDTVSSIGFLQKDDNSTNYGLSRFVEFETDENGKKWYVNALHGPGFGVQDMQELSPDPAVVLSNAAVKLSKAVLAAGSKMFWGDAKWNFHRFNVTNYGLYSHQDEKVKHTFHICAMDEFRENFALVNLGSKLDRCAEVFVPGCHSDIGGGLMKYDDIDRYTLRRKIKSKPTRLNASCDPRKIKFTDDLSKKVLDKMGWLRPPNPVMTSGPELKLVPGKSRIQYFIQDLAYASQPEGVTYAQLRAKEKAKKLEREKSIKEGDEGMPMPGGVNESGNKIEFEKFSLEGYSNITLEMMKTRAMGEKGLKLCWPKGFLPFSEDRLPPRFKVEGALKEIRDSVLKINVDEIKEGETTWYIPEKEQYEQLRKNYLHFSCTDELNPETGDLKAAGANLGNTPCWKRMIDCYMLTRLVYNGDKDDNDLHYIYDYPPSKKNEGSENNQK